MPAAWIAESESLVKAVDPVTFKVTPVYIVAHHELDKPVDSGAFYGHTSVLCDLQLQAWLAAAGLWRGRGFAAVIDTNRIRAALPAGTSPATIERSAICTVLHETAHHFETIHHPGATAATESELDPLMVRCLKALRADDEPKPATTPVTRAPWFGHGERFIRAAAHIAHRAERLGFPADLGAAGERYELSEFNEYVATLDGEPERLAGLPLADVLDMPLPAAFVELFRRDTRA